MGHSIKNANVNNQNSYWYKFREFFDSLKNNGVSPTINKITQRIGYKIKGIDFSPQNIFDLTITGEHKDSAIAHLPSSHDFIQMLINDLDNIIGKKIDKDLFLDYGSGKGGAIIHAKNLGFSKSIGIEFAKELDEIAKENIKKFKANNVTSIYGDAAEYLPPLNVSVIYMLNPFDETVMKKVAKNISSLKGKYKNDVYIIYGHVATSILEQYFQLLLKKEYKSGAKVNYYKV
jgi:16S rRNA G966 N2-methylase RsmD